MNSLWYFPNLHFVNSRFGTWPVAMLEQSKAKAILEGPVCNGSQVIGWNTNEKSKKLRRFHVDMSGFAFNSTILWDPKRWHRPTSDPIRQLDSVKEGFQVCTIYLHLRFQTPPPTHTHPTPKSTFTLPYTPTKFTKYKCKIQSLKYVFPFFPLGDHLYRTSGGRWKPNGRNTGRLFKDHELASPFGSSWTCLS